MTRWPGEVMARPPPAQRMGWVSCTQHLHDLMLDGIVEARTLSLTTSALVLVDVGRLYLFGVALNVNGVIDADLISFQPAAALSLPLFSIRLFFWSALPSALVRAVRFQSLPLPLLSSAFSPSYVLRHSATGDKSKPSVCRREMGTQKRPIQE